MCSRWSLQGRRRRLERRLKLASLPLLAGLLHSVRQGHVAVLLLHLAVHITDRLGPATDLTGLAGTPLLLLGLLLAALFLLLLAALFLLLLAALFLLLLAALLAGHLVLLEAAIL
jgi:hypothetical protein